MAIIQSGTDLTTYADMVQYICDAHQVERTGLNERHARAAVRFAYRDLPARHQWNYYYRQRLLQTSASYATGTIDFDYTGGANERQLTLASGTWPSWAAYGRVIIDSVHYDVDYRVSDSVLTLTETSNPGEDVAAATTYILYRNSYPLPANFGVMSGLWSVSEQLPIYFIDQRQQHTALQVFYDSPSSPRHATIRATGKYLSGLEIVFGPPPDSLLSYDMLYIVQPRPLLLDEYASGTVAITSGSATVTGTNTTFPTTCAGSIIRFASGAAKPTGPLGSLEGADNPFVYQGVIKTRGSATSLTLEESLPSSVSSLSGVGYTISDPIDIDPYRMLTPLQRMAEAEFSRLSGRQDMATKINLARQALREAMEADELKDNTPGAVIFDSLKRVSVVDSE